MKHLRPLFLALVLSLGLTVTAQTEYRFNAKSNGFSLTGKSNTTLTICHNVSAVTLESTDRDGLEGQSIILSGVFAPNEAGAPNLPSSSTFVAIPNGSKPSVTIARAETRKIQGVDLIPAPLPQLDDDKAQAVYEKDMAIYGRNAFYPATPYNVSEVETIRGVQVVKVGVMPFQYNPVTKELIVYENLELELTTEGGDGTYGDIRYRSPAWDQILGDLLLNREVLPEVDYGERLRQHYENRETGCEYLIITPDNEDFIRLADSIKKFRTEQGIATEVYTVSQCGGNDYQTLRSFIRDAYDGWDMPLSAVLLLGDHHTDPTKGIVSFTMNNHPGGSGYNPYISDHAYAVMDNTHMPEIIVGRITGRDFDELYQMIKKDLDYERTPPTNPGFYDHPITAMGFQLERWFQLCSEIVNGFWEYGLGKHPVRQNAIYQGTPGSRWSTYENTNTVVDYFGPNGCGYIPQNMSHLTDWSATGLTVNEAINNGAFILQHRDHGAEELWGEPSYGIGHILKLTNKDLTYVMSNNCLTGKFNHGGTRGCFAEVFHRHQYGALGLIAATEVSYSFVNDIYVWGAYDNMWPDFMPTYGTQHPTRFLLPAYGNAAGKYFLRQSSWTDNGVKQITYYLFHQHGDVYMNLYSEVPQPLTVDMLPVLVAGSNHYDLTVDEDATICLTANGQIIGFGYGTGEPQQIAVTPQEPGTRVKLTITKQDYYRYEHELATIPDEGAYLIFNDIQIHDTEGDDDQAPDYNESCTLGISLHNVGFASVNDVKAQLTCAHPAVEILQGEAQYNNIPVGETLLNDAAFTVHFGDALFDQESVRFHLRMEAGDQVFVDSVDLRVQAPILEYNFLSITDLQGEPLERLQPGESVLANFEIRNDGHSKSQPVHSILQMIAPFTHVADVQSDLDEVTPGIPGYVKFRVDVDEESLNGCIVDYRLQAESGFHQAELLGELPLGNTTEDFEGEELNPNLQWSLGSGNNQWYIVEDATAHNGHCLRSPEIGNNKVSSVLVRVEFPMADKLSFLHKTSTEEGDELQFLINAEIRDIWSGIGDWERSEYALPAGTYTLKFSFRKDAQGSDGDDCVMIDHLLLPPLAEVIFYAGDDTELCANEGFFTPNSYAVHYKTVLWETQGDGVFNNIHAVSPIYQFGTADIDEGQVVLDMQAQSAINDMVYNKSVTVTFANTVEGTTPERPVGDDRIDLRTTDQSQYEASMLGANTIRWQLQPAEAGTAEADDNRLTVVWNTDFRGVATLYYILGDYCGDSEPSQPLEIEVFNSTGVDEIHANLEVYPNPAKESLRVTARQLQGDQVVVRLTDLMGRTVYESCQKTVDGSLEITLNTARLSSGIYHLKVLDGTKNRTSRLVVE